MREPLYREIAVVMISTDGRAPKSVAGDIIRALGARLSLQRLLVMLGKLRASYPILAGPGLLGSRETLAEHAGAGKLLVVTDDGSAPLWMPRLEGGLAGREFGVCVLPGGEA